jgi:hypothetical protein
LPSFWGLFAIPYNRVYLKVFHYKSEESEDLFQDQLSLRDYKMCLLPIPDSESNFILMAIIIILQILNCVFATYQGKVVETLLNCSDPKRQKKHEVALREKFLRKRHGKWAQSHMTTNTTGSAESETTYQSYLLSYPNIDEIDLPTNNH